MNDGNYWIWSNKDRSHDSVPLFKCSTLNGVIEWCKTNERDFVVCNPFRASNCYQCKYKKQELVGWCKNYKKCATFEAECTNFIKKH